MAWLFLWGNILLPVLKFAGMIVGWVVKVFVILVAAVVGLLVTIGSLGTVGYLLIDQLKAAWQCGGTNKGIVIGSFSLGAAFAIIMLVALGKEVSTLPPTETIEMLNQNGRVGTGKLASPIRRKKGTKANPRSVRKTDSADAPPKPIRQIGETPGQAIDRAWRRQMVFGGDGSLTQFFALILPSPVRSWASDAFESASAPVFDSLILDLALFLSITSTIRGLFGWGDFESNVTFVKKDLISLAGLPVLVFLAVLAASEDNS